MADTTSLVTGGVDTHKDFHVCVAVDELGRVLGTEQFPTTLRGYRSLLRWLGGFGQLGAVGVEGTGSWGAGLARFLTDAGVEVIEVNRPNRQARRKRGKSDPADAEAAARAVLAGEAVGTPKAATGTVESIRLLRVARRSAMKARTQAANQVHSVIDTAPEELRAKLIGLKERERITKAARMRSNNTSTPLGAAKLALASLARRWLLLTE
jgi:transposase